MLNISRHTLCFVVTTFLFVSTTSQAEVFTFDQGITDQHSEIILLDPTKTIDRLTVDLVSAPSHQAARLIVEIEEGGREMTESGKGPNNQLVYTRLNVLPISYLRLRSSSTDEFLVRSAQVSYIEDANPRFGDLLPGTYAINLRNNLVEIAANRPDGLIQLEPDENASADTKPKVVNPRNLSPAVERLGNFTAGKNLITNQNEVASISFLFKDGRFQGVIRRNNRQGIIVGHLDFPSFSYNPHTSGELRASPEVATFDGFKSGMKVAFRSDTLSASDSEATTATVQHVFLDGRVVLLQDDGRSIVARSADLIFKK